MSRLYQCHECAVDASDAPDPILAGVSVAIFAVFTCTTLESGVSYLDADARIVCYDSVHKRYMGGAAVWLVLIPFGVPAFFLWLLRRFKVPQMASLLSDNAYLLEGIKLAWAEGLVQPAEAGSLTVDSISTLHLEALFAYFLHDVSAEDAAEILAGTRPPVAVSTGAADAEDPTEASPKKLSARISQGANEIASRMSGALGKLGGVKSGVSKRILLMQSIAAKAKGQDEADARRTLLLTTLLAHFRTTGDFAVRPLLWGALTADEVAALGRCSAEAVSVHASGLCCAEVPKLLEAAIAEVSFLFAAYRIDCWYWCVLSHRLTLPVCAYAILHGTQGGGGADSEACAHLNPSTHRSGKRWAGRGRHSDCVHHAGGSVNHLALRAEKPQPGRPGCATEPLLLAVCCSVA